MLTSSQARVWSIVAALTGGGLTLSAPTQAAPVSADPAHAQATVPPVVYQSPFANVRKLNDAAVGDWRRANERLLGHRGGPAASAPAEVLPKPDPHAGHSHSKQ